MIRIGIVYKITNKINNKLYIGITKRPLEYRWNLHKHCANRYKKLWSHLYSAMRKYGIENFEINILKTCYSDKQLYRAEIYFIKKFDTTNRLKGYNISKGGEVSTAGRIVSRLTRKKLSLANKKRFENPIERERIATSLKGRIIGPRSEEVRAKISLAKLGRKHSEETKLRYSIMRRGKPSGWKGRKHSIETRKKLSEMQIGKKATDVTKQKMSISAKVGWDKRRAKNLLGVL